MTNLQTFPWERMFWTRICFYITTKYNNSRTIPDTFKQNPGNKKICNISNVWFNHDINFFYDKLLIMSNLVKLKLWHMDAYDGTTTEQQVELLI